MSALGEVLAAAEPALRAHAVEAPGPDRFAGPAAYVLEAVHEGFLLHSATPRAFRGMDEDLQLLAGDALYAQGLARLAAEGDLTAVAELADLITGCAHAQAEDRVAEADVLWAQSAARLGGSMADPSSHG